MSHLHIIPRSFGAMCLLSGIDPPVSRNVFPERIVGLSRFKSLAS